MRLFDQIKSYSTQPFTPRSDKELKVLVALLVSFIWLLLPYAGLPGHFDVVLTALALGAGSIAAYGWLRDDELAQRYRAKPVEDARRRATWKRGG